MWNNGRPVGERWEGEMEREREREEGEWRERERLIHA